MTSSEERPAEQELAPAAAAGEQVEAAWKLRSTVVVRWEYRPGATVFAIWSHGRTSDAEDDGRLRLGYAHARDVDGGSAGFW